MSSCRAVEGLSTSLQGLGLFGIADIDVSGATTGGAAYVSVSGLTQYFTVNTAVGHLSASDKRVIAGLGKNTTAELIEIR